MQCGATWAFQSSKNINVYFCMKKHRSPTYNPSFPISEHRWHVNFLLLFINEYSIRLSRPMKDNVTSKMIWWRVILWGRRWSKSDSTARKSHKEKPSSSLRVKLKLNMDKHYIIYNHITMVWVGSAKAKDNSPPYLHIIICHRGRKPTSRWSRWWISSWKSTACDRARSHFHLPY